MERPFAKAGGRSGSEGRCEGQECFEKVICRMATSCWQAPKVLHQRLAVTQAGGWWDWFEGFLKPVVNIQKAHC